MKKSLVATTLLCLFSTTTFSQEINVKTGWQLLGAINDINLSKFDNTCVDYLWKYIPNKQNEGKWQLHISNNNTYNYQGEMISSLNKEDGFWLYANSDCSINLDTSTITQTITLDKNMLVNKIFYANFMEQDEEQFIVFSFSDTQMAGKTYNSNGNLLDSWSSTYKIENGIIEREFDSFRLKNIESNKWILENKSDDDKDGIKEVVDTHEWLLTKPINFPDTNDSSPFMGFTSEMLNGKNFYTYQFNGQGIYKSAYPFLADVKIVDCNGNSNYWANCEEPNVFSWEINNGYLIFNKNNLECNEKMEFELKNKTANYIDVLVKSYENSCKTESNCINCEDKRFYLADLAPLEALKTILIGNKLANGSETYYFRDNDILLADTGDDFTKFLSYGGIVNGKLKLLFGGEETGEYDLISKIENGYKVEFIEYVNGVLKDNGEETITSSLESFTQNEIQNVLADKK